jgi:PmbA protein
VNDLQTAAPPARGSDLLALVDIALREAKARGADQAEAAVSIDVGLSVSVRLGEVETVEYQRDRGMGVTVYFGTRKGAASTADLGAPGSPIPTRSRPLSPISTCRTPGRSSPRRRSSSRAPANRRRWPSTGASRTPTVPA